MSITDIRDTDIGRVSGYSMPWKTRVDAACDCSLIGSNTLLDTDDASAIGGSQHSETWRELLSHSRGPCFCVKAVRPFSRSLAVYDAGDLILSWSPLRDKSEMTSASRVRDNDDHIASARNIKEHQDIFADQQCCNTINSIPW